MPQVYGKGTSSLVDLDNRDVLLFEHLPDDISDNVSPAWTSIEVVGRSSPLKSWGNTGPRGISLEIMLAVSTDQADMSADSVRQASLETLIQAAEKASLSGSHFTANKQAVKTLVPKEISKVVDTAAFLRSLVYPDYDITQVNNLASPPPRVLLSLGSFLKIMGVVMSCDVTWKRPWTASGVPMLASCSISIESTPDQPFSRSQVRSGDDNTLSGIFAVSSTQQTYTRTFFPGYNAYAPLKGGSSYSPLVSRKSKLLNP